MDSRPAVLVSACCCGLACRYHGRAYPPRSFLKRLGKYRTVQVCPEQLGGLPTPRPPAHLTADGRVVSDSQDVTAAFVAGARRTLAIAREYDAKKAYLLKNSPSCGANGVTAGLLRENGIRIVHV